jgi:MFS transporter, FHS family, L-fucose permease
MMIMGGAIVSLSQGFLADVASIGVRFSFFAGVICFGYLAFYAVSMLKRFKLDGH